MIYFAKSEQNLCALFEEEKDALKFAGDEGKIIADARFSSKGIIRDLLKKKIICDTGDSLSITSEAGFYWDPKFNATPELKITEKGYVRKDLGF